MQVAKKLNNELERLESLKSYKILDTNNEICFDNITTLASIICETPISLISLIDEKRQWFKSKVGIKTAETHRNLAFCAHAILNPTETFIVNDTLQDKRFFDNDLVTKEPYIRFYAGAPLKAPDGQCLGTLCVIDTKPKILTKKQESALNVLADNVITHLELRKQLNKISILSNEKDQLLKDLRATSKELENFAFTLAHDIKSPLMAMCNFSEIVNRKIKENDTKNIEQYLEHIKQGSLKLNEIVDSYLEYAKTGGKISFKKISLEKILESTIKKLTPLLKTKNTKINYTKLPKVKGDAILLEQLLQNLICNSVTHGEVDPLIIKITSKEIDGKYEVCFADNGIGIAKENLQNLFTPFQQTRNGLGLPICKKIINSHGGNIWYKSSKDKGARFYFTLEKQ